jgi:ketosteroid isomerase-like protein
VSADRSGVEAANAGLYRAVETGDLDLMEAVWDEGDVVCVHPGAETLRGRGTVLRSWAAVMVASEYMQFFLTDVKVDVTGDTAVVTCTENVLTGVEGDQTSFQAGRAVATNVFRRRPGGWRLVVHHASPVLTGRREAAEGRG